MNISGSFRKMAIGLSFFVLAFFAENQVFGSQTPIAYFDPQNNEYSGSQNTINILYSDGSSQVFLPGPFAGLMGMAVGNGGNIYVSQWSTGSILKFTQGGVVSTFASGFNWPSGGGALTFDKAGNLLAQDMDGIHIITPGGAVNTFASGGGLDGAYGCNLVFDSSGNLYATGLIGPIGNTVWETGVLKITPSGSVSTYVSGLEGVGGLALDSSGNLYVSEYFQYGPWDIKKVDPQGNVSTFASSGLCEPTSLMFDHSGNLWAADWGWQLSEITPDGSVHNFSSPYEPGNFASYIVPEPATLLLLGLGAVMLRRKRS